MPQPFTVYCDNTEDLKTDNLTTKLIYLFSLGIISAEREIISFSLGGREPGCFLHIDPHHILSFALCKAVGCAHPDVLDAVL